MIHKVDARMPAEVGKGAMQEYPALATPWGKLVNVKETAHYAARLQAVYASLMFEAMRILVPDYDLRSKILCDASYMVGKIPYTYPGAEQGIPFFNIPPFMTGCMQCGVSGDYGDEVLLMDGRVNDCGSYRVEKEIDHCPWDIVGSELGRSTTSKLKGVGDGMNGIQKGPDLDLNMVEAKCCGDLHCRIVAENRDRYPLPGRENHELYDCYGPIVTGDQIRFTKEKDMVEDGQYLVAENGWKYVSALSMEVDAKEALTGVGCSMTYGMGVDYGQIFMDAGVQAGLFTKEQAYQTLRYIAEGAGKAMFCDTFAIRGLREWLGVPDDVHDGRMLGGYIEMTLQAMRIPYEIEEFNKTNVIYRIKRDDFMKANPGIGSPGYEVFPVCAKGLWYGMSKTLIDATWSLWEDQGAAPDDTVRLLIGRRVDKRCS